VGCQSLCTCFSSLGKQAIPLELGLGQVSLSYSSLYQIGMKEKNGPVMRATECARNSARSRGGKRWPPTQHDELKLGLIHFAILHLQERLAGRKR
jgi:hypothetical protein